MGFLKKVGRYFRRPRTSSGYVYYAKIATPSGNYYKIGYTSKPSLEDRFASARNSGEVIKIVGLAFKFEENAWDIEQDLLDHFSKELAFGKYSSDPNQPLYQNGQSELFRNDVLGLDNELYEPIHVDEFITYNSEQLEEKKFGCMLIIIGLALTPFTLGMSILVIMLGLGSFLSRPSSTDEISVGKIRKTVAKDRPQHPDHIKKTIARISSVSY